MSWYADLLVGNSFYPEWVKWITNEVGKGVILVWHWSAYVTEVSRWNAVPITVVMSNGAQYSHRDRSVNRC